MEEKNRSNTLLLTVIAVATLLVAVIGATFAYFTAAISGTETASTVQATSARLEITFADGTSLVVPTGDVQPRKGVTENETTTYEPFVSKNFTLTGTNTTGTAEAGATASPGMRMPYKLFLIVTKNNFVLQNQVTTTSISYKLVNNTASGVNGAIPSNNNFAAIPALSLTGITYDKTLENGYDPLQRSALGTVTVYKDDGTALLSNVQGLELGTGYFEAGASGAIHNYTLELYFVDDNKNQDEDTDKEFEGYVTVSAGDAATKISGTVQNVNNANA